MMSHGFVYVLGNEALPDMYKVGFTSGSPSLRCAALSAASGVPMPFELICYAEFANARAKEAEIHSALSTWRVSQNREFFEAPLDVITEILFDFGDALSKCHHNLALWEYEHKVRTTPNLRVVGGFE